jgi:ribonuclease P protein component
MRRAERLTSSAEFRKVFRKGVRVDGRYFLLVALQTEGRHDRAGLAVSRRIGGAVARSRAKRLLRESFRRNKRTMAGSLDVIFVAKPDIVGRTQRQVEDEYRRRLKWLLARSRRSGGVSPASPAD